MRWIAFVALCLAALTSCRREKQESRPSPARVAISGEVSNPYHGEAYAISEGQRLFNWYNCSGCHANGGGGIGPPLIKSVWIYGGEPAKLFETIVKGRPNGMPAWGKRIPEYQIWQLVAYVRSLNGKEPDSATPARADMIQKDTSTLQSKVQGVTK